MLDLEDDYYLEEDKLGDSEDGISYVQVSPLLDFDITIIRDYCHNVQSPEKMNSVPNSIILDESEAEGLSFLDGTPDDQQFLLGQKTTYLYQDLLGPDDETIISVEVFDNTPVAREGTLQSGDELVGVNGQSVKGKTKVEVAKMIQACKEEVSIKYNKLHADPTQGKTLDIILKKVKHRLVENMSTSTADALGLSRAILCNDTLVKKLEELESTEVMYRGLVDHSKRVLKAFYALLQVYKAFGDVFAGIGVREPQPRASEAFRAFGDYHRLMEKNGIQTLKTIKPILSDLGTYLNKAIPDTKLTIRKYADAKFEYLSYCLKVKEMDDEEYSYAALQEPLYRVETGNYEYRLILRCRQEARAKFARLRSDVLVKLELLDNKHVQDIAQQLHKFVKAFAKFYEEAKTMLSGQSLFPIEMDLARSAFQYQTTSIAQYEDEDDDELLQDPLEDGEEVKADLEQEEAITGELLVVDGGSDESSATMQQQQQHSEQQNNCDSYLSQLISELEVTSSREPQVATLIGLD